MTEFLQYVNCKVKIYYEQDGRPAWAIGEVETANDLGSILTIRTQPRPAPPLLLDYGEIKRIIPRKG